METLNDLSDMELKKFKNILQSIVSQKNLPDISWALSFAADTADIVNQMVQTYGQQSVELTREVFMDMKRTDLVQRLSKPSSGLKEKHSVGKHPPAPSEREISVKLLQQKLLETLKDFSPGDLEKFKHVLLYTKMKEGLPSIPRHRLETADRVQTVKLMVERYGQQSEEVIREVFNKMNRRDLVQRLSDISSGSEGPSRNQELEGCAGIMQDSSDWTKLKPEVNSTDADEAPTYSLQSEAGNFECSVSGLRWVCKEKVSFKYQFCSWEEPMERMERIRYMPAGPLINITAIVGKLVEVYLPHWICIDDNPKILKRFAVLHIDDCGDVVEKVSEVTSSHVKLYEPIFSPRAVLMKVGFPVKISCDVLIYYKPNTPFLKLHVYLIPHDPALQQTLDKKKFSQRYELIQKPRPDKYLKMQQGFNLAADMDTAKILPERITLRYDSQDPNFYEVFIKKPDRDFHLTLSQIRKGEPRFEPVWTCEIRTDDYQNSAHLEAAESLTGPCYDATVREKHSVDEHLAELMQKGATITTDRERLLNVLGHLKQEEFKEFKWFLQDSDILTGLPCIPRHRLEKGDMLDVVDLMLQTYSQQSVELTKKVFQKIHRNDLVQML
ncbi:NACHT, LRR and PYD domains-containing protein 1a allele 5-like [Pagrus major]|uniref:NACHT, LRR and PYD domains-containing protein 1a allele 5-like n=1 Tax=Pagrus major TaxID=143350 RepID=UPI003CC8A76B